MAFVAFSVSGAGAQALPPGYVAPKPSAVFRDLAYGPEAQQRLDLHLPATAGPYKVIVYAHSGGWCCGDKKEVSVAIQDALNAGWAVASINYKVASTVASFPQNVHDFKRATRWVRSQSAVYRLNPNMVVAAGTSSGGHLAALAAVTAGRVFEPDLPAELAAQRSDYQGLASFAGPVNLVRFSQSPHPWHTLAGIMLGCGASCTVSQLEAASPVYNITPNAPPSFLAYGALDTLVVPQEGVDFASVYKSTVPVGQRQMVLNVVADGGHNFDYQMDIVGLRRFLASVATDAFHDPIGAFEDVATVGPKPSVVTGWVIDPDTVNPTNVHVYVDGRYVTSAAANTTRTDIAAIHPTFGSQHGFAVTLPPQTPGRHRVCVFGINVGRGSSNTLLNCREFSSPGGNPFGNVDGTTSVNGVNSMIGWAIDPDVADPVAVHAYLNGGWYGAYTANVTRTDVGKAFPGYGNTHGFAIPLDRIPRGTHTLCVYAINVNTGITNPQLGCRTVTR